MAFHTKIFNVRKWLLFVYFLFISFLIIHYFCPLMKWLIVCVFILLVIMDKVVYYLIIPLNTPQYLEEYLNGSFGLKIEGYFNNDNSPSEKRLLFNLLESIFFTNSICKYEIKLKIFEQSLFIIFLILYIKQEDVIISGVIGLILFLKLLELIKYMIFIRLTSVLYDKILDENDSGNLCNFIYYNVLKYLFKIYPSSYIFNYLNERLSMEWEKEKSLCQDHIRKKMMI